ncbi:ABC transporter permease subunit [Capillibacterium thermochitinicola]|uniref:ABC transporter permease n=1 Tax=Capillibacterium thermochitinicola TaxID=2699427 RepID=A0A8J6HS41_9FIRM|nr:ABC transporter permease [Capillibacterium thermochitinicola]MBA2133101.1 ABC transporter permease [Capillibacterium thermochitinicola]
MALNTNKVTNIFTSHHLKAFYEKLGLPRLIISSFLLALFILAFVMKMDITILLSDSLARIGMNGLLVLAMLPTLVTGVGLNFGLPVGFVCGLVGGVISLEYNLTGFTGFFVAILCAIPLAVITGYLYASLLDRVRGQEMMVGTYVGFAVVAGMCIFWLTAPFNNPSMIWAIGGQGLRVTITLYEHYSKVLNNFLAFKLFGVTIPTGLLLFFGLFCWLIHLFFRTRTGLAMLATGANPMYAKSSGIDTRAMRYTSVIISNVLAAIGALVYAQSYGFLQLYTAPLYMAFPAVAAALIGGASLKKATVSHIIIGTVLFQTLLTIALPVTQTVLRGTDISEIARMIISNGMILYALTRNERG